VINVQLPPLRERREDIPVLAKHFLSRFAGDGQVHISQGAMRALMAYSWPGNVRQLENAIERAVALTGGRTEIDVSDLPPELYGGPAAPAAVPFVDFPDEGLDMSAYLESIERDLIKRALARTGGNRNKAAELLRIKRTTLVEKLKRLGAD
jgi:DNA-binding NtrC family response regulator